MTMKVYYVHIGVETLLPVTSDEIEEKGRYCAIDSLEDIKRIRKLINNAVRSPGEVFSDKTTRVKLIDSDGSMMAFIDNYGGVRFRDGRQGKITGRDLKTLKNVIESRCGIQ